MKSKTSLSYISVVAMAVLLAFNYYIFIITNHFAPAGLNGIATMVQYKTGFSISYMSLLINIPLSILAFFFVHLLLLYFLIYGQPDFEGHKKCL